jgi:peptide/nickel transport system ATP-binding protein/oligopeptide transport system ATP-binding protein
MLLDPGTAGEVDLATLDPKSKTMRGVRGGRIGLIFQEPMTALSVHYTVGNQIIEAVRQHSDISAAEARNRAIELLGEVGIPRPETRLSAYPFELSGGLRQRVGIAMALAGDPQIVIADEPTTALDVTTQAQILALLQRLQREKNIALMLITHDMGVIAEMADDVAVMYAGRVVERTTARDLFEDPQHPYTLGLLGSIPRLDEDRERLLAITGAVPPPFALPPGCRFAPRCPFAIEACRAEIPGLRAISPGHEAACIRAPVEEALA